MTAYELIQRLAKFPADTVVKNGFDWSDVVLDDCTDIDAPEDRCIVVTAEISSRRPVGAPA